MSPFLIIMLTKNNNNNNNNILIPNFIIIYAGNLKKAGVTTNGGSSFFATSLLGLDFCGGCKALCRVNNYYNLLARLVFNNFVYYLKFKSNNKSLLLEIDA